MATICKLVLKHWEGQRRKIGSPEFWFVAEQVLPVCQGPAALSALGAEGGPCRQGHSAGSGVTGSHQPPPEAVYPLLLELHLPHD